MIPLMFFVGTMCRKKKRERMRRLKVEKKKEIAFMERRRDGTTKFHTRDMD